MTVDVHENGGNLGMLLAQRLHKSVLCRENRRGGHQHHHNLPALKAPLHQYMAQKARFPVLIVRQELEALEQAADGNDDFVRLFILNQAVVDVNHPMGTVP